MEKGRWWSRVAAHIHSVDGAPALRFRRALLLGNPSCGEEEKEKSKSKRKTRERRGCEDEVEEKVCTRDDAGMRRASEREREMNGEVGGRGSIPLDSRVVAAAESRDD